MKDRFSLNGHHNPVELDKKRFMRVLKERAHKSFFIWSCCIGGAVVFLLTILVVFLLRIKL